MRYKLSSFFFLCTCISTKSSFHFFFFFFFVFFFVFFFFFFSFFSSPASHSSIRTFTPRKAAKVTRARQEKWMRKGAEKSNGQ